MTKNLQKLNHTKEKKRFLKCEKKYFRKQLELINDHLHRPNKPPTKIHKHFEKESGKGSWKSPAGSVNHNY